MAQSTRLPTTAQLAEDRSGRKIVLAGMLVSIRVGGAPAVPVFCTSTL